MAKEELDALLARMDAIAKAANAFSSEALQKEAFAAMIAAFEGKQHGVKQTPMPRVSPEPHGAETGSDAAHIQPPAKNEERVAKAKRSAKGGPRYEWKMVKDLNLHPEGKQSFEAFVEEKKPSSNEDKYVVIVYYLKEIIGINIVTIHQVGTVFRLIKTWKVPKDVASGLHVTSHRKATLDTKNFEDIKLTPTGLNFVEHDLPPKAKSKK